MRHPSDDERNGRVRLSRLGRRAFLRAAIGTAGTLALAACGRGTPKGLPSEFATASAFPLDAERGLDIFPGGLDLLADTEQRVTVGLVRDGVDLAGEPARLWVSDGTTASGPYALTYHRYERVLADGDPHGFYAGSARLPVAGFGTFGVEAERVFGTAVVEIRSAPTTVGIGERFPAIATPTFDDRRGVQNVCTREPACPMHARSLAEVLGRRPVVFTLASPLLCTSRTCGPVVDEIMRVRRAHREAGYVHAEVWRGNSTTRFAPASRALGVESEPWTFVLDGEGFVRARFEGPVTADEIEAALLEVL